MTDLRIARELALPIDAATRATVLVGLRGSGKTFTAAVLVEEVHRAGVPVVVVDPVGAWWGIRSDAAGTGPGLPFVIFGGDHADVPLEEEAGELLAQLVVDDAISCVLDLSLLRKGARRRFMTDFAEALYHRSRSAMFLVVDEAPMFAPQRADKGSERLLGAMEDIVLRGRGRGIGITLITQRAALLHASLRSQCEVLFALRQNHPLDRKAIQEWIAEQAEESGDDVIADLATLPTGEGFVWSPSLGVRSRVHVRMRETFDSSATPKPGERRVEPRQRAAIDLDAIRVKVAATIDRAKAEDPAALRARIAELEARAEAPVEVRDRDVLVIEGEQVDRLRAAIAEVRAIADGLAERVDRIAGGPVGFARADVAPPDPPPPPPRMPAPAPRRAAGRHPAGKGLRRGAREMLRALASMRRPLTRAQIAMLAGMSPSSGTFSTYLGDLRSAGLIEDRGASIAITDVGLIEAGAVPRPASTADLQALWGSKLRAGARRMLDVLIARAPRGYARDELGAAAGIESSSGTFSTYLGDLTRAGLAEKRGHEIVAASTLFLGARR